MPNARDDVARATAGLVLALFLSAVLLVAYICFRIIQNMETSAVQAETVTTQVVRIGYTHVDQPVSS